MDSDTATILNIEIYDKMVLMDVKCNKCNSVNTHNVTHSITFKKDHRKIDFSILGKRCCDSNNRSLADYKLYQ